jgi:hypothetical protein
MSKDKARDGRPLDYCTMRSSDTPLIPENNRFLKIIVEELACDVARGDPRPLHLAQLLRLIGLDRVHHRFVGIVDDLVPDPPLTVEAFDLPAVAGARRPCMDWRPSTGRLLSSRGKRAGSIQDGKRSGKAGGAIEIGDVDPTAGRLPEGSAATQTPEVPSIKCPRYERCFGSGHAASRLQPLGDLGQDTDRRLTGHGGVAAPGLHL